MARHLLVTTVAGAALFVGAAQAADIQPITVPAVVSAPVAVPGPVYRVEIDTDITTGAGGGVDTGTIATVDVRTASGLGFKVEVVGGLFFEEPNPVETDIAVLGRIYHTVGTNGTVGVFASHGRSGPMVSTGSTFGLDADFDNDTLWLNYSLAASVSNGTYEGVQSILAARLERDRLQVRYVNLAILPASGPFVIFALGEAGYTLGPLTPYVQLGGGYFGGTFLGSVGVGADLELPIGDGPLTLTAGGFVGVAPGGFGWETYAGFELNPRGGPVTLTGRVYLDDAGWGARLGIGLEYGTGRITGYGARLVEDFFL